MKDFDSTWHTRLLALIMFGMSSGIYHDHTEVPLWKIQGDSAAPPISGEDSDDDHDREQHDKAAQEVEKAEQQNPQAEERKEAIKSGTDLKALRSVCKGSMHVALCIGCKDGIQNLCRTIYVMIHTIREEHGYNAKFVRTVAGVQDFYLTAAKGRTLAVLEMTCQQLLQPGKLEYMGFTIDYASGLPSNLTEDHDMCKDQNDTAAKAMGIWVSLAKFRAGSMMWHYLSWPGLLALLLSSDKTDVDLCLQLLARHYNAYVVAAREAEENPWLQKVVSASPFKFKVMEEIALFMISPTDLSEDEVSQRLQEYARDIYSSLGQTKIIEDTFQKMRTRESTDTRNKAHHPLTYWTMAKAMGTIEAHGRDAVQPVGVHDECDIHKKFCKDNFNTKKWDMTIDNGEAIMDRQTWPSFSPLSAQFHYGSSEFLAQLHANMDAPHDSQPWENASRCWRGVLFQRGLIVMRQDSADYFVSLGMMETLMVGLWRVKPMVVHSGGPDSDSDLCFVVGSGDKDFTNDLPTWVNPIDMDSFDAVPTRVISPINLWLRNGKRKAIHHGVVYLKTDEPLPLMTLAAQKCFTVWPSII